MRLFTLSLLVIGTATSALAQTNYLPYAPAPVVIETNTGNVRELSLQDCIQLALQQNLDIQVGRYSPLISFYTLKGAYGPYDPAFFLSGQHDNNKQGSRFANGLIVPGQETEQNSFISSLGGGTPWGMTYSLDARASDTEGKNFSVLSNVITANSFQNSGGEVSGTIRQPLLKNLWIDINRLTISQDKNTLKQSEQDLRRTLMDQITQVEKSYYRLIEMRENVVVQVKAVELAEQLVAENRKRVEVGALAPLDEKQAESQAATSRADLIQARSDLAVQEHLVKKLIGQEYAAWAPTTLKPTGTLTAVPQSFDRQDSWGRGLTKRPEYLSAKLDVENAGLQVKYSHNQLFPQLDVFATYGYNGSGTEFSGTFGDLENRDRPFYTFGASITVPIGHVSVRNKYKQDKASLEQVVLMLKRWERDIMMEIDNDISVAQASFEKVSATRAAREYSEDALAAEQKKLESGKSTTYTVLQMQRDLTAARAAEIAALSAYNQNLAQLSFDEGSTLNRLAIDIQPTDSKDSGRATYAPMPK